MPAVYKQHHPEKTPLFALVSEHCFRLGLAPRAGDDQAMKGGAICFPQRFGGSLNLNVHFHGIVPDALFYRDSSSAVRLEVLRRPSRGELDDLVFNVTQRVARWLKRKGYVDAEYLEGVTSPTPLDACVANSMGMGELARLDERTLSMLVPL